MLTRAWAVGAVVTGVGLLCSPPAQAAPGELDPAFGSAGVVRTTFNHTAYGRSAVLDTEDRIVVAGTEDTYGLAVLRYGADGSQDTTFDGDGITTTPVTGFTGLDSVDVALDAQRRPVVLASAYETASSSQVSLVVRYTATGALDTTFGTDGHAVVSAIPLPTGIGIRSDGAIIAAGRSSTAFTAVRLAGTDGAIDNGYGTAGVARLPFASDALNTSYANDALVDGNGRAVIAATISHGADAQRYAVIRFTTGGQPDTSFDGDGLVETPFSGGNASTNAIAVAPGDRLVVAGDANANTTFGVARYLDDGRLDTSFDGDGLVTTAIPGYANAAATAVQVGSDGRVAVAGFGRNGSTRAWALSRYLDTGAANGTGITVTADLNGHAAGLVAQSGGRLVGAGYSTPSTGLGPITLVGYQDPSTGPSPPPGFVPRPPAAYVAPATPPLYRVQGVEVTQGSQMLGVPQFNQTGGAFQVNYRGVKLARGGRTLARVFVDSQVNVFVTVTGYNSAGTRLGSVDANPTFFPTDTTSRDADVKQQTFFGGYQVEIPRAWAKGRLRLQVHVTPQDAAQKCSQPECGDVSLANIAFTPVRPVKVRLVALLDNGTYPPYSAEAIGRALSLAPQGESPIVVPQFYAGTLEIGDLKIGTTTCTFGFFCKFRTRDDTNPATLERLQDWDEANPPKRSSDIDITIGVSGDPAIGISNGASVFPFLGLKQGCSIGGIGSLFLCTRPVVAISEADADFTNKGRPLSNAGHELFHALGRPHASKACGGGGGGLLNNMGEDWPLDQVGRLNGVGLDFGRQAGHLPIPFVPRDFGNYFSVVPPQSTDTFDGGSDVGQTNYLFDLMSYCGAVGNGDPYKWLSPKNWDAVLDKLSTGKAGTRRAQARAAEAQIAVTDDPSGPRKQVDVIQTDSGTAVSGITDTTGRTAAVADPASAPHAIFRDASGRTLSDTPMESRVTHTDTSTSGVAKTITFMRALAPMPPAGVSSVAIVDEGKVLDERKRSAHPPTVKNVSAGKGGPGKRKRFMLTWRSGDRDGDRRQVTVAYAPDGRTFRAVHVGNDRGKTVLLTESLVPGRRARFKVTVDDGFDRASAISRPVTVQPRPPLVEVDGVPSDRKLVPGTVLVLGAQASESNGTLSPARLRWFVNKKLKVRGTSLRVVMPKKGNLTIRLVAKGKSGLLTTRTVVIKPGRRK